MADKKPERISIPDLKKKLKTSKNLILVDVREPKELVESGSIPTAMHIPMGQLDRRMTDFPKSADLVFY